MRAPINANAVKPLDGHQLGLTFSDGREGVRDRADILVDGGPMVEPMRSLAMFPWFCLHGRPDLTERL
jgi:hypothetical protein